MLNYDVRIWCWNMIKYVLLSNALQLFWVVSLGNPVAQKWKNLGWKVLAEHAFREDRSCPEEIQNPDSRTGLSSAHSREILMLRTRRNLRWQLPYKLRPVSRVKLLEFTKTWSYLSRWPLIQHVLEYEEESKSLQIWSNYELRAPPLHLLG